VIAKRRTRLVAKLTLICNLIQQKRFRRGVRGGCPDKHLVLKTKAMATHDKGTVAVIFIAQRTLEDEDGYRQAAGQMDALASAQPGYCGMDSVRGSDGLGITVSYWSDEAAGKAWRDHAEHAAIREAGRDRWYSHYSLHVAEVTRSYDWMKRT
jgi:heme-degrading monooxygenase HmoA